MINVVRIKAVSECMGIRRASLVYALLKDGRVSLRDEPHPLKKFQEALIKDNTITVDGKSLQLLMGEEVYFYRSSQMDAGGRMETERMTLGAMILPLCSDMQEHYEKAINEGFLFDQWNGEFEYLLGLMQEYDLKDMKLAEEWYQKALDKKFTFELKEGE